MRTCLCCGKEYDYTQGQLNWTKTGVGKGRGCVLSSKVCSYVCGIKLRQENIKKANLEKYGVENTFQSESVKSKIRDTNISKYGVENPAQCRMLRDKAVRTCIERYGVDNPAKLPEMVARGVETSLQRYGTRNPQQSVEVKSKTSKTVQERYGHKTYLQSEDYKEKTRLTNIKKYGHENVFKSSDIRHKIRETNLDKYGVPYYCMTSDCIKENGHTISKTNLRWKTLFEESGVEVCLEKVIGEYSYDFMTGRTLIEINPTYTHNSSLGTRFFGEEQPPKDPNYHMNRSKNAEKHGFKCIHVWGWDDPRKILSLLSPKRHVYARNLDVKEITIQESNRFVLNNHLQRPTRDLDIKSFGLFEEGQLVQVMTFGKPRYNKKVDWELIRLCSNSGVRVVGGSSRLFSAFLKTYDPKSVISYCDNSKFSGNVYEELGFKLLDRGSPTPHWYNGEKHITDNLLRQLGADRLIRTSDGKGSSNEEIMVREGFVAVYDCGQSTWVWSRP